MNLHDILHRKKIRRNIILFCAVFLCGYSCFTLYDTFLRPKKIVQPSFSGTDTSSQKNAVTPVITDTSYRDDHISVTISRKRIADSDITIADVTISDPVFLKTGLADGVFGRNVTDTTSAIARECNAVFAVNGDFYGFRDDGIIMRNAWLYRNVPRTDPASDALCIDQAGDFSIFPDSAITEDTISQSAQIFSFGPGLVIDGTITENAMAASEKNPRTAIGQAGPLHYIFAAVDGRTDASAGMFLTDLAWLMKDLGCETAYNLDGGGSTAMYFMGKIINTPADGQKIGERKVSDIVYIGY